MTPAAKLSLGLALAGTAWALERSGAWAPGWVVLAALAIAWVLGAASDVIDDAERGE